MVYLWSLVHLLELEDYNRPQQGIALLEHSTHGAGPEVPMSSLLKFSSSGNESSGEDYTHSAGAHPVHFHSRSAEEMWASHP